MRVCDIWGCCIIEGELYGSHGFDIIASWCWDPMLKDYVMLCYVIYLKLILLLMCLNLDIKKYNN